MDHFEEYFKALQNTPIDTITEHSHRTPLENLLNAVVTKHKAKIKILHEPRREGKFGSPDFKITSGESIVGYVENKKLREILDNTLKTDQLKKYKELSNNLLLTNYIDFIWIKGDEIKREQLCFLHDVQNRKSVLSIERVKAVELLIQNFFSQPPQHIDNPKKLAQALAIRAKWLKAFLKDELERQHKEHQEGTLSGLYDTFKTYIFHELTLDEFADAFSQNLVYGLFLATLNAGTKTVDLYNAKQFIPGSFELIRELVNFLDELEKTEYRETRWIIEEVLTILNNMAKEALQRKLFYRSTKKEDLWGDKEFDFKDPFIYFYEDFLAAYDKKLRKAKGVYYTPPPIVNFIVRAIDDIIVNTLGYKEGLADKEKVTVLDFATGTGTFLLEVCKQIFARVPRDSVKRKLLVKDHILKNLFGFEYLIAPYTIAHLKLSQFLKDEDYVMQGEERVNVFLTNTLEPAEKNIRIPLLPALSEETNEAQKIKDKKLLVITGNPPYSIHSKNPSEHKVFLPKGQKYNKSYSWHTDEKLKVTTANASKEGWYTVKTDIGEKLMQYFFVDGMPLGEKNPKALQDDYVKFMRFAQDKMDKEEEGVIGIITNHSFLDNPTFRGMRQSLMNSFNQIYFIDLHGNSNKKETTPEGGKDENVFDIEQGVAISFFIKKKGLDRKIYTTDWYGKRKEKYNNCWTENVKNIEWKEIKPDKPFYSFKTNNNEFRSNYEGFLSIKEIFIKGQEGIKTHRNSLVIDFNKESLSNKINAFLGDRDPKDKITEKFRLKETNSFSIDRVQKKFSSLSSFQLDELIKIYQFGPFDIRSIFYEKNFIERSREETMKHMNGENIALNVPRQVFGSEFKHVFATSFLSDINLLQSANGQQHFPLYLFDEEKHENFSLKFRAYMDSLYEKIYTAEQIVGYIYAILHSPTYKSKYSEFLISDFPRIPFTPDKNTFEELSDLGGQLIQAHLLKHPDLLDHSKIDLKGKSDEVVEKPEWKSGKLFINKTQWFEPVTKEVYDFYIGGYQVLDKYLKDRKGRNISNEIYHLCFVIQSLQFTIEQMKIIDEKTSSWI